MVSFIKIQEVGLNGLDQLTWNHPQHTQILPCHGRNYVGDTGDPIFQTVGI